VPLPVTASLDAIMMRVQVGSMARTVAPVDWGASGVTAIARAQLVSLAFVVDTTGSMDSHLAAVKEQVCASAGAGFTGG
jgi:hypothetical protein